jgi:glutamyl-tRNA reductase
MNTDTPLSIANFIVAGVNYKKTNGETRGQFAINADQYANIIKLAPNYHIKSVFILSTCNRTEIYGFANNAGELVDLLCTQTTGNQATFKQLAYIKNGTNAVEHLFNVGAGLDSQILGDYEIIGQLKKAVKFSMDGGFINCFTERLFNNVLQASKAIKNHTELSNGSVSVSFAAVQYIKQHIPVGTNHKILVIGIGKIGRNTCKNLVDYLGTTNITLINRSEHKAEGLAAELGLNHAPLSQLPVYIDLCDIILVATNAPEPVIATSHVKHKGDKLILDLSIPYNVEPGIADLPNVTLINVDELSKMKDENLKKRDAEIPKARKIIASHLNDFLNWHQKRQASPMLKAIKIKLGNIYEQQFITTDLMDKGTSANCEAKIQRVVKDMACKMQLSNHYGCHSIEAINEFMLAVAN